MATSTALLPHDNYGPQLTVLNWVLLTTSALFLFLRLLLKIKHQRGLWWDDYILVASWVALAVQVVLACVSVSLGYGKHIWDVLPQNLPEIVTLGTVGGTLTVLAAAWSKTSFAFTLLRLPIGRMTYLVWFIIISMNALMHLSAVSIWIECPPGSDSGGGDGDENPVSHAICLPMNTAIWFGIFVGGYSAAMDFTLAIFPWKFLWKLQMKRTEKVGVLIAMSTGVFASMAAVVKTTKLTTLESVDLIEGVQLAVWGTVEVAVTIMAASIPILRALFLRSGEPAGYTERGPSATATAQPRPGTQGQQGATTVASSPASVTAPERPLSSSLSSSRGKERAVKGGGEKALPEDDDDDGFEDEA